MSCNHRHTTGSEHPLGLDCPACGTTLIGRTGVMLRQVFVCGQCRALVMADRDPGDDHPLLRRLTDDEETAALSDPTILECIAQVAEYHQTYGPPMNRRADDGNWDT